MKTTIIRIDTLIGTATIRGQGAKAALAIARSWLKHSGVDMGGGRFAYVSIAIPGGRWHTVGRVGNHSL